MRLFVMPINVARVKFVDNAVVRMPDITPGQTQSLADFVTAATPDVGRKAQVFFKRRSSLLQPWSREEVLSRAKDCYGFAVRYKQFPKPGQFEPELEEEWVQSSAASCCFDAVRKLSNRDFVLIASNGAVGEIVTANWNQVAEDVLNLFALNGYRRGSPAALNEKIQIVFDSFQTAATFAGWQPPFTAQETERALELVKHLQRQSAFQQLAMETYNDALAVAAPNANLGDEMTMSHDVALFYRPQVQSHVLPTLEKKLAWVDIMIAEHEQFGRVEAPEAAKEAYDRQTGVLEISLARARLQQTCWLDFLRGTGGADRITSLDQSEYDAVGVAITTLNKLIAMLGLSRDEWLDIVHSAFNDVRSTVGLSPLSSLDFRARFLEGQAGGRARFFQ